MIGPRPLAAALAAFALVAAAACRAPQARFGDVAPGAPGGVRVVVAPMNLALRLATDLEDAVEPVSGELVSYLRAHGVRVATVDPADAWNVWRDASAALEKKANEPPRIEVVASAFARVLARETSYDVLVIPSLIFRNAKVEGRFAEWDGVRRRIRVRVRQPEQGGGTERAPDPDWAQLPPEWRGKITGLSLHVLLYTAEGRPVFQGFGGLDLVHDAIREREASADPSLRLQRELLDDPEHIREGVALALDPYVAPRRTR